jgi:hypothetical protein
MMWTKITVKIKRISVIIFCFFFSEIKVDE